MITSFEVGSIFRIVNQATPQLRAILKSVTELDTAIEATRKNLTGLSRTKLVGVGNQFKAITAEVVTLDRSLAGAANAIGRFAKAPAALAGTTSAIASQSAAVQVLATEWGNVAASASTAAAAMRAAGRTRLPVLPGGVGGDTVPPRLPPPLPGAGRRGGAGGGGRHGPRQGWHLGNFGASIPVAGGHVHASTPTTASGVAAGAAVFGVYELAKAAQEPLHQQAMLKLLGINDEGIGRMSSEARQIAIDVPGSGYSNNMKTMGELFSIVGLDEALAVAPKLAEIDRVQSLVGGKGKDQGSAYVLTRATELMGALTNPVTHQIDMKGFGQVLDTMSKISIATHGKVTPEEWLNYAKQAGPAAGNLTEEGFYTSGAIMQAMGGNRGGTAAQALQRQFAGGKMTAPVASELEHLGVLKPGEWHSDHGHVSIDRGAMKSFVDKLQKDPLSAVTDELIPALEKQLIVSNEDTAREIYKFIGIGPAQREVYELIRGRYQIMQERERAKGAWGPQQAIPYLNQNDPISASSSFGTAFHDLLGAIGSPLMTAAIPAMSGLTTAFNELSAAATKYPKSTGVLASIGAGAALGGAAGFGVGWLGGPVGAGGGAVIGAGAGAAYSLWNALPDSVTSGAKTGAEWGLRSGIPLAPIFGGIAGGWLGGAAGYFGGPSGAKAGSGALNVVPPPPVKQTIQLNSSINLDGRQIAEVVTNYQVKDGNGPAQGSPYPDSTRGGSSFDFALVP
jgi:hypothetical protein